MLKVGLTGGLACGKSTVAALLQEKGCGLIDADRLGHEAIAPDGPAHSDVVAEFGRDILDGEGRVDRARLAACVFRDRQGADRRGGGDRQRGDPQQVRRLNELVHPHILRRIEEEARKFADHHSEGILIVEAALLLEAFAESQVDKVVVVDCAEEQQIQRFQAKGGTAGEARRRMAAQMTRAERLQGADFVVDTSGPLEQTRRQVNVLYQRLVREALT